MDNLVKYSALVISIVALTIGFFNFYWTHIRRKKSLNLVRIDKIGEFNRVNFALVNGGSDDVLFTKIESGFNDADNNGASYPAQIIEVRGTDSNLLSAGKAFHCTIDYPEEFTSTFALAGEKSNKHEPNTYMRDLHINLEWVEMSGKIHKASVTIAVYGFLEDGTMRHRSPLQKEHDLYKA